MTIQDLIDGLSAEHLNGAEVTSELLGTKLILTITTQLGDVIMEAEYSQGVIDDLDKQSVKQFVAENAFQKLLAKLTTVAL